MIAFELNGSAKTYSGEPGTSLLVYLREIEGITSVKDGCSGQAGCGACLLEIDGKPALACVTPMKKVNAAKITTIEGFPASLRETLGRAFVARGAVQCGFCTPGFLSRTKMLLESNPDPSRAEIIAALRFNLCRCTGYVKIIEAVELAATHLANRQPIALQSHGGIGKPQPKYHAYERAIGASAFVDDIRIDQMLHAALRFSDHPHARVRGIHTAEAVKLPGVIRVFTGADIPGKRHVGVIKPDWPVMVVAGETTRYIGDVLAGVVAETEAIARKAAALVSVDYDILEPLTDVITAENSPVKIHSGGNRLGRTRIKRGDKIDVILAASAHVTEGVYNTQRVEHGFLETEAAVAAPLVPDGVELHTQSQGVYEDRRQVADILGLDAEKVIVNLVPSGGAFGGKEDLTVQGHAALFCHHLKKPVKLKLSRDESIRMHPKRHPMQMTYKLGCDRNGRLTGLYARIIGDTGAYASLGAEVLARAASHASAAYYVPHVDIEARAIYTNNIPGGAMRGFGVNQVTFAMESCVDQLCDSGGFDRWQFRYDNVLKTGDRTASGQVLGEGVGLQETLLAVKEDFDRAKIAGLACGLKNCGIGNGVIEECEVGIDILSGNHILLQHGWTEMGQGVDTVAQQILCEASGLEDPTIIEVRTSTRHKARAGMTTASRATFMLGKAIMDAASALKADLKTKDLSGLAGTTYHGAWMCDWTTDSEDVAAPRSHYAYGYATHLVALDDDGKVDTVVAAHDGGRIINPTLFEGQIEGAVVMGLGYALTEELPMVRGRLKTKRFGKLGLPRIADTPKIIVKGIEVPDPLGPYGAKGVGEIGNIPTAAATANALFQFDRIRRFELPMKKKISAQHRKCTRSADRNERQTRMTLYLKNATYIDWQTLTFHPTHLAVQPGADAGTEQMDEMPAAGSLKAEDTVLDCHQRLVTKSFGCGHHHIYSALARGMPAPPANPRNFPEILEYIWWRVDKALDKEMIEASALAAALFCVKNGVTFIIDHHASPYAIEDSLEIIARAFDRIGVSHLLCYEMSDRDGEESSARGLAETERFLSTGGQGHVGLHASFTVGDQLLQSAVALAQKYDTGIHVHVAEDAADQRACLKDHRQRVVARYKEAGALDMVKSVLAHCIHLDDSERNLLRDADAWIVQNVESNQNNNVGLADYSRLGENVMLGTDGMHNDMLRSAKAAFLAGQAVEGIDMAGIYRRFRNVHNYIAGSGFKGDGDNNLVILNYDAPTEINQDNFVGHFVYGLDAGDVDSVVSNGRVVVENRQILTVDEDEILAFSREMGNKLWRKLRG